MKHSKATMCIPLKNTFTLLQQLFAAVGLLQTQTTINWKNYSQMAHGSLKYFPCFIYNRIGNMSNFKLEGSGKILMNSV